MSAGDSITAGLGARWSYTRPTLFVYEDCGVSFATGGDEDVVSLAKLMEEKWSKRILGKSFGSRRINLCIDRPSNRVFCPRDPIRLRRKYDGYNVALTGSTSEALPLQYSELIKRFEEDSTLLHEGRILLTLVIGANDLCLWDCHRPESQLNSFNDRIDILVGELPALEGIPSRANGTLMEPFALLECPCAYYKPSLTQKYSFKSRIEMYNQVIRNLPSIIITDALRKDELKDWPSEMTSKLDAFHPSKWAHSYFAEKIFQEHFN